LSKSTSNFHLTKTSSQEGGLLTIFLLLWRPGAENGGKWGLERKARKVNSSTSDSEPEEYRILEHDWDGAGYYENGDVFSWESGLQPKTSYCRIYSFEEHEEEILIDPFSGDFRRGFRRASSSEGIRSPIFLNKN